MIKVSVITWLQKNGAGENEERGIVRFPSLGGVSLAALFNGKM